MNKFELVLEKIVLSAILLIVLILLWAIFTGKILSEKFNPNNDVCDEWECENYAIGLAQDWHPVDEVPSKDYFIDVCRRVIKDECLKYHKANKCELCSAKGDCSKEVSDGDCVCDDYKTQNKMTYLNMDVGNCSIADSYNSELITYYMCIQQNVLEHATEKIRNEYCGNKTDFEKNYRYYIGLCEKESVHNKTICIKSHLPNECEKNNPDYFFDINKEYQVPMNETYCQGLIWFDDGSQGCGEYKELIKISIPTGKQIKTCRKKTIQDYNCSELRKLILLQDCEGKFNAKTCFPIGFDKLDKAYMLEYFDRCGGIIYESQ